jgi:ferredoxin
MRIRVDPEVCQGHTLCAMSAPDLFVLSEEDGHARAISEEVPSGQEDRAREAVRSCPEQAILVLSDVPAVEPAR